MKKYIKKIKSKREALLLYIFCSNCCYACGYMDKSYG